MKIKTLRYYMFFLYILVEIMSMSEHMPPCLISLRVRFDEKTLLEPKIIRYSIYTDHYLHNASII